jgi:hypothetical protein
VPRVLPTLHGLSSELKTLTERLVIGNRSEDCIWYNAFILVTCERRQVKKRVKRAYAFYIRVNVHTSLSDKNLKSEQSRLLSSVLTLVEQVTS